MSVAKFRAVFDDLWRNKFPMPEASLLTVLEWAELSLTFLDLFHLLHEIEGLKATIRRQHLGFVRQFSHSEMNMTILDELGKISETVYDEVEALFAGETEAEWQVILLALKAAAIAAVPGAAPAIIVEAALSAAAPAELAILEKVGAELLQKVLGDLTINTLVGAAHA